MSQGATPSAPSMKATNAAKTPNYTANGSSRSHAALCRAPSSSVPMTTNEASAPVMPVTARGPDVGAHPHLTLSATSTATVTPVIKVIQKPAMARC